MRVTASAAPQGDWGGIPKPLMYQGWLDSELSRSLPFATWMAYQKEIIDANERAVIGLWDGERMVGGIVLIQTMDAQVGPAVIALHQFILPEYRGRFPYRQVLTEAIKVAKGVGSKYLIWTHRKPSGRIFHTYKEV